MKSDKVQIIGAFIVIGILIIFLPYTVISTISVMKEKLSENEIDFSEQYPFEQKNEISNTTILDKYKNLINYSKKHLERCTSNNLIGFEHLVECSYCYNKLIGYNLISNSESSARVEVENGYFTQLVKKLDISKPVNNLVNFKQFLDDLNAKMLYVQAPFKISESQSLSPMYKDYSNENMNDFLGRIKGKIDYIDLRENIKNENLNHLKLFYRTDHHWLPETGLWATNVISKYLNDNYNMNLQTKNVNNEKFDVKVYTNIYLGADGRYVTLANSRPENLNLLIPTFDTKLTIKIPDKNIYKTDTYENTLIDWTQLKYDYYNISPYHSYGYGDRPLIEIHNELVNNNKKILLIRDSFSDVVVPFLALENEYLSVIDLRKFNGSLKSYIRQYNPDMVIVMYFGNNFPSNEGNEKDMLWSFE